MTLPNVLLFFLATSSLILGLVFIYKPTLLIRFNKIARERFFNDNIILLERRKKGVLFILLFFIFLYWGYYRFQYVRMDLDHNLISTSRLLYQSLQHLQSRQYETAIMLCEKVLAREPDNTEALLQKGASHLLLGNPSQAQKCWAKADKIDPDSPKSERYKLLVRRLKDKSEEPSETE